ncbi:MAG: transposase domain-containing protein, partial [Lachnospiraceae bacterium]|nr:transposase domain-containing protein [Lachnospiraceae bacterium]
NDLNVYEYFKYLFEQMPNNDYCNNPEVIDSLLPWSKELPDICHLSYNRKKHV